MAAASDVEVPLGHDNLERHDKEQEQLKHVCRSSVSSVVRFCRLDVVSGAHGCVMISLPRPVVP